MLADWPLLGKCSISYQTFFGFGQFSFSLFLMVTMGSTFTGTDQTVRAVHSCNSWFTHRYRLFSVILYKIYAFLTFLKEIIKLLIRIFLIAQTFKCQSVLNECPLVFCV